MVIRAGGQCGPEYESWTRDDFKDKGEARGGEMAFHREGTAYMKSLPESVWNF